MRLRSRRESAVFPNRTSIVTPDDRDFGLRRAQRRCGRLGGRPRLGGGTLVALNVAARPKAPKSDRFAGVIAARASFV